MKMRIGGYDRDVRHRGDGLEAVRIRWPPGTRTPKHNHHSGGCVWVLAGRVFEIQDGRKSYYAAGASFLEVPGGVVHIVGNDSSTDAVTFHVYRPELVMELFSDSEADLAALHGATI
ncbi:MAG: cupin domain-containing protein [Xanthobacteraceae bacterium]